MRAGRAAPERGIARARGHGAGDALRSLLLDPAPVSRHRTRRSAAVAERAGDRLDRRSQQRGRALRARPRAAAGTGAHPAGRDGGTAGLAPAARTRRPPPSSTERGRAVWRFPRARSTSPARTGGPGPARCGRAADVDRRRPAASARPGDGAPAVGLHRRRDARPLHRLARRRRDAGRPAPCLPGAAQPSRCCAWQPGERRLYDGRYRVEVTGGEAVELAAARAPETVAASRNHPELRGNS